jgi:hypothetical protein
MLQPALIAGGFNTCTLPQKEIATRAGVERPIIKAYDSVCVAVLPPACRDYTVDHKPCAYRACMVPDHLKSCPNGDPLMFTAATIEPYRAKTVKPISPEELAALNRAIDAEAKRMAAKWTDNGRVPLSPAAVTVLQNLSCQMVAFGNPNVRCVPR